MTQINLVLTSNRRYFGPKIDVRMVFDVGSTIRFSLSWGYRQSSVSFSVFDERVRSDGDGGDSLPIQVSICCTANLYDMRTAARSIPKQPCSMHGALTFMKLGVTSSAFIWRRQQANEA